MLSQQSQEGLRHLAPGAASVNRGNHRGGWFRVGLLAAAVSAPIFARWNDLRGRARIEAFEALREEAESRLSDLGANLEAGLENARTLIASGEPRAREALESVATTASAMQDFAQSAAKKVSEGLGDFNENVTDFVQKQRTRLNRGATGNRSQQVNTALWLTGIGVGVAVAGVGAYLLIRRRLEHAAEEEALLDAPLHSNGARPGMADGLGTASATRQNGETPTASHAFPLSGVAHTPADEDTEDAEDERPAYIGNIHTLIYHDANSGNLPALENQVYFSDEEQAQAAGFHRDRSESAEAIAEGLAQHMAVVSTEPPHESVSEEIVEPAEQAESHAPEIAADEAD